jgi:hypothetical protein
MRLRLFLMAALALGGLAACDVLPHVVVFGNPSIDCGAFEGPDCNDLLEIGLDAIAAGHTEDPLAIAVDNACPPNARCAASPLGGNTAAVVVRWPDGTIQWATIPLPADWPESPPGEPSLMPDPAPAHILPAVGVEAP